VSLGEGKCQIFDPDGEKLGEIPKSSRGLYKNISEVNSANSATKTLTLYQFHRRMGHISVEMAQRLISNSLVTGIRLKTTSSGDPFFCKSCVYTKATRKPVLKVCEGEQAAEIGGEIHSDLWGPAPLATKAGRRYYITFTDDKTQITSLHLQKSKDEAFDTYKDFKSWCETQFSKKIKLLYSDHGGEYLSNAFQSYLKSKGTTQKLTVHDTPQHNGVAEQHNRTILEHVHALLHACGLPKNLWGEVVQHVVWLMNRTLTKSVEGTTPFEAAFGKKSELSEVREWGEKIWVRTEKSRKLSRGYVEQGHWLGINKRSKGHWRQAKIF